MGRGGGSRARADRRCEGVLKGLLSEVQRFADGRGRQTSDHMHFVTVSYRRSPAQCPDQLVVKVAEPSFTNPAVQPYDEPLTQLVL